MAAQGNKNLGKPNDSTKRGWSEAGRNEKRLPNVASEKLEIARPVRRGSERKVRLTVDFSLAVSMSDF
jgi:hypothetical protein